ncbi:MAG: hypothetical protein ACRD6Q_03690 [Nitrososphaeraceae archaeon]
MGAWGYDSRLNRIPAFNEMKQDKTWIRFWRNKCVRSDPDQDLQTVVL